MLYPRRSRRQDRRSEPRAAVGPERAGPPRAPRRDGQSGSRAYPDRTAGLRNGECLRRWLETVRAESAELEIRETHAPRRTDHALPGGGAIWGAIKLGAGQTFRHEHNIRRRNVRNRPVGGSSRDREAAAAHSPSHASVFSSLRAPPDRRQAVPRSSRCRFTRTHARARIWRSGLPRLWTPHASERPAGNSDVRCILYRQLTRYKTCQANPISRLLSGNEPLAVPPHRFEAKP